MPDRIILKLDEYILGDHNYAHMQVGERSKFAISVEDVLDYITLAEYPTRKLEHIKDNRYKIYAKVLYKHEALALLDVGEFCIYLDGMVNNYKGSRKKIKVGDHIHFAAELAVDEFLYKLSLHKQDGMLPIIYECQVEEIEFEGSLYPYIEEAGEFSIDFDKKQPVREKVLYTDLEEDNQINKDIYKVADFFLISFTKTAMLPRFTVMSPGHHKDYLNRFKKEKADAELYQIILQNKSSYQGAAQIDEFVKDNFEALQYQIPKQEQVKQYESLIEEFFAKVIQEFNYKDCLIQDESTIKQFMLDHSHEEILYLIKREYGVELPELNYDFTFIDFAQQLKLVRNSKAGIMASQIKKLPVRQNLTNPVAKNQQLKNKNIIPDPPGNVRFLAGPTRALTEKDHEEMREHSLLNRKKHAKLIASIKIRKNQKGKL